MLVDHDPDLRIVALFDPPRGVHHAVLPVCLVEGPRFHVKQLQVDPGHGLSPQMHYHRSEHWVVVDGAATDAISSALTLGIHSHLFANSGNKAAATMDGALAK